jgi:hypothetical protein
VWLQSTFGSTYLSSLTIGSCLFDGNGGCVSPLAGAENQSQFAIDNLQVVPEPETYAMMGLGLGLVGWLSRRRARAAAAASTTVIAA